MKFSWTYFLIAIFCGKVEPLTFPEKICHIVYKENSFDSVLIVSTKSDFKPEVVNELAFCLSQNFSVLLLDYESLNKKKTFYTIHPNKLEIAVPDLRIHKPNFIIFITGKILDRDLVS